VLGQERGCGWWWFGGGGLFVWLDVLLADLERSDSGNRSRIGVAENRSKRELEHEGGVSRRRGRK
jgi:hypothetical protein